MPIRFMKVLYPLAVAEGRASARVAGMSKIEIWYERRRTKSPMTSAHAAIPSIGSGFNAVADHIYLMLPPLALDLLLCLVPTCS